MELECAKEINKVDDLTYDVVFYDNIKDAERKRNYSRRLCMVSYRNEKAGNYEKLTSYLDSSYSKRHIYSRNQIIR
ncbi:MAG: hypothetical protein ACLUR5_09490 [Eubacterium ventriosum]